MTLNWFRVIIVSLLRTGFFVSIVLSLPFFVRKEIVFSVNFIFVDMCVHPIVVTYSERLNKRSEGPKVQGQKHSVLCTCGKCVECLKQYQNDWMVRLFAELKSCHVAVFCTLTYDEDTVPLSCDKETGESFRTVCKDDLQTFLKNFREQRRKKGLSTDYKWFFTSEYGPTTLRPHYHGLFLGLRLSDVRPFLRKWSRLYGFTSERELFYANTKSSLCTLRYTAKYCAKGDLENPLVSENLVDKNFHLISKSIGKSFFNDRTKSYFLALDFSDKRNSDGSYSSAYLQEIYNRLKFTIPPCSYHLPRYYREMVFEKRKDLQTAYSNFVCERVLAQCAPSLVRISTDKPYPSDNKALRLAICRDYYEDIRTKAQRSADALKSVCDFYKHSKL